MSAHYYNNKYQHININNKCQHVKNSGGENGGEWKMMCRARQVMWHQLIYKLYHLFHFIVFPKT